MSELCYKTLRVYVRGGVFVMEFMYLVLMLLANDVQLGNEDSKVAKENYQRLVQALEVYVIPRNVHEGLLQYTEHVDLNA